MAKRSAQFQTIRTEGAILPPDILRLVASLKVDGATPDAYHLPPGSKPGDAISQSWTSLLNHWQAFQEARANLPESDLSGTAVTNERWLLPLFKELDYGRLVTTKSPEIDDRVYPIERFYNHTPIHLIGCKLPLDRRTSGARGAATASPHSMVQEFINRSDEHLWAFLSNGLQLRILRDNISLSRQAFVEFDLEAMMDGEVYADFALLWLLCHQSRVESDKAVDCWLEKWSHLAREQGTRVLNDLRLGVAKAIEALGRGFIGHPRNDRLREKLHSGTLTTDDFYRQLLRIVYRLLFLFVAEDRELLHPPEASEETGNLYDTHYSTRRLRELALRMRGSKHADLWHSLSLVFAALGKNEGCFQLGLGGLGSFLWETSSTAHLLGTHQVNSPSPDAGEGRGEGDSKSDPVLISNDDLLQAIRELAYVEQDRVLRTVDYRNLGSEELGSVYESLLELHPVMNVEAKSFELMTAAGNERKTTGSYYTPDSLVQCLLDSALDPVVEDRLKGKKGEAAEQAILDMKVCDPACGSGHFLIAAAHRMARHLARTRTGESEPSPEDYQHALRDIIGRCIYGVDINPMAVELCKVSLWMEALEPGKPLSFLDHHIQCGNSLLGTTPALLRQGIPDDAFKPIEGDVKALCSELRKDNKRQRQDYESGQGYLFDSPYKLGNLPASFARLSSDQDDSVADVAEKERRYARLVSGADYQNARLLADTWCAVFVWRKDTSDLGKLCPTERDFRKIETNPHSILPHVASEVRRLADQYQFFHWHLAFPDVFRLPSNGMAENDQTGWNDGFDAVLGNPPWDRFKVQEKEFFAQKGYDEIVNANSAKRKKLLSDLAASEPEVFAEFENAKRKGNGSIQLSKASGLFQLCAKGSLNTYALFAEQGDSLVAVEGNVGMVLPSGIAMDTTTKDFFDSLMRNSRLLCLFDFENRRGIFPGVDSRTKFAVICWQGMNASRRTNADPVFVFFAHAVDEIRSPERRVHLSAADIALLNPQTRTSPTFLSRGDAEVNKLIYRRIPILKPLTPSRTQWNLSFSRMFHMSDDSPLFRTADEIESDPNPPHSNGRNDNLRPLYEAKFLHQFDHRHADCASGKQIAANQAAEMTSDEHADPNRTTVPRYWLGREHLAEKLSGWNSPRWLIAFRDVTRATDFRTCSFCAMPAEPSGHTVSLLLQEDDHRTGKLACQLLANFNSFALDYCARQKPAGIHLPFYVVEQLPILQPAAYQEVAKWSHDALVGEWIDPRVLELTYTAWDLEAFALDCGYAGPPFRWDEERRFLLRCELDAAYFQLYLGSPSEWGADSPQLREMFPTPRHAADYIMETFPIVKRKDEQAHGSYRTKETIVEIYDEMAEAIRTGQPYQTRLDPPPGPPVDAEGNFIPMSEWDENNWPSHIHRPKET